MTTNSPEPIDEAEINAISSFRERFSKLNAHFGRFLWDVLGVLFIALSLISLLGVIGLTRGTLMTIWIETVKRLFGWGLILIIAAIAAGGVYCFRRSHKKMDFKRGRLIGIELSVFIFLALLSLMSGNQLSAAEQGKWGGQVGWGIASLFSQSLGIIWGGVLLIILWIVSFISALNFWGTLEKWVVHQAGDENNLHGESIALHNTSEATDGLILSPIVEARTRQQKKKSPLPVEFQKNFKLPTQSKPVSTSLAARSELLPPLNLLLGDQAVRTDERTVNQIAGLIEKTLSEFGIPAKVVGFRSGPTVTQYAVQPGFIRKGDENDPQQMKVRVAQIASLQKDLTLALSAERLRIEAPVPGHAFVGIEVPNSRTAVVHLRPLIESELFQKINSSLAFALGRDVSGNPVVADLARMPHLLIAGTTGSGKSVCIALWQPAWQ